MHIVVIFKSLIIRPAVIDPFSLLQHIMPGSFYETTIANFVLADDSEDLRIKLGQVRLRDAF